MKITNHFEESGRTLEDILEDLVKRNIIDFKKLIKEQKKW